MMFSDTNLCLHSKKLGKSILYFFCYLHFSKSVGVEVHVILRISCFSFDHCQLRLLAKFGVEQNKRGLGFGFN